MTQCNMTSEFAVINEIPLSPGHWLTFRRLILIFSSIFGLTAVFISVSLIMLHATHYSKPWEQKHIIRIITMVPIYATLSWFSFMFYGKSVYIGIAQLVYEAIAVASFYMLMCHWIAPDLRSQKDFFRHRKAGNWAIIRFCGVRGPKSGLSWFTTISAAVFQYVLIRPLLALIALVTQATKRYCNESLSPGFAHIWVVLLSLLSVTVAMWGIGSFYFEMRKELASHKPAVKFIALKLVIFFTFGQGLVINLVTSSSHVNSTPKLAIQDLKIGLPAILVCIEMALFAMLHIFTYSWKEYRIDPSSTLTYQGGHLGLKGLADAYNPWDIINELGRAWRWVFVGDQGEGIYVGSSNAWGSEEGQGETSKEAATAKIQALHSA